MVGPFHQSPLKFIVYSPASPAVIRVHSGLREFTSVAVSVAINPTPFAPHEVRST
jgi:hypothetical protein